MSKYEEMCDALAIARKKWPQYQENCYRALAVIFEGFIQHCGIPRDQIALCPLDKEPGEYTMYSVAGAAHLADDGFWHMGIRLTLNHPLPPAAVLMALCLTEHDGKYHVKTTTDGKPQQRDLTNEIDCRAVYDEMAANIMRVLTSEPPPEGALKIVGFAPEIAATAGR